MKHLPTKKLEILAIGAHPDDVELHTLGTILKYKDDISYFHRVVVTEGEQKGQTRINEQVDAYNIDGLKGTLESGGFRDGYLYLDQDIISFFDRKVYELSPDIILTHSGKDYHQDHRVCYEAARAAIRGKNISLITYPQNNKFPNKEYDAIIDITKQLKEKNEILNCFRSQKDNWYFKQMEKQTYETFSIEQLIL